MDEVLELNEEKRIELFKEALREISLKYGVVQVPILVMKQHSNNHGTVDVALAFKTLTQEDIKLNSSNQKE